jgi:predicted ABC-type transport system involved in lysophospholipase L1 biosynthesis ATPase subunit
LGRVGMSKRAGHRSAQLSVGERQRVALARALANDPALLLADEPTGNLDSDNAAHVLDLLTTLQRERGLSLVMVTHSADLAGRADRVVRMRDGRVELGEPGASAPGFSGRVKQESGS